jgi:hypothetical protein
MGSILDIGIPLAEGRTVSVTAKTGLVRAPDRISPGPTFHDFVTDLAIIDRESRDIPVDSLHAAGRWFSHGLVGKERLNHCKSEGNEHQQTTRLHPRYL